MLASEDGNKEVVELFLSAGAHVNRKSNVCIFMIVMMKNILSFCILCDSFVLTFDTLVFF